MNKTKTLETSLVLTTGFLVVFLITEIQWFIYLSITFGLIGIFIKPLAKYIAIAWFKLADILNFFIPKIVMGILFLLVLVPISLIYRIFNKDKLQLKRSVKSNWIERNQNYKSEHLKNIW